MSSIERNIEDPSRHRDYVPRRRLDVPLRRLTGPRRSGSGRYAEAERVAARLQVKLRGPIPVVNDETIPFIKLAAAVVGGSRWIYGEVSAGHTLWHQWLGRDYGAGRLSYGGSLPRSPVALSEFEFSDLDVVQATPDGDEELRFQQRRRGIIKRLRRVKWIARQKANVICWERLRRVRARRRMIRRAFDWMDLVWCSR